ncbi:hypothetical protein CEUSTIGMA_g4110.t1 [Chlamydomonas eustigma]|uniref:Protein kinase domain-containing protein n=1 Tax=Chlamydomonas eustigma TaxID=1157962 RepID=A0A250X0N7_9CHLO|nr:hypothetical protein CEUSTIGMA_g4110.t1 [Chlamydomonas eustigma]|eukprot:GAX76664.1 hypothetical protein CEUSTIGMA_g4110.t1 [Chlamydomonas eustigma]
MFQKVKKFRDKLFSSSNPSDDSTVKSPTSLKGPGNELDDLRAPSYKKSSIHALRKESESLSRHGSFIKTGTTTLGQSFTKKADASMGIVPSVQINNKAALVPTPLGSSPSVSSHRRKSTPAALDMALKTAEGRAVIEDLLNNNSSSSPKKPMAFAQYFGATSGSRANNAVASSPKGGANNAGIATSPITEPRIPAEPRAPLSTRNNATPKASNSFRQPGELDSSRSPSSKHLNVQDNTQNIDEGIQPDLAPPKLHRRVDEEDINHPGRKNKLLSLSPNLPQIMARKFWSIQDYAIGRKMYTGYASTVYQATCKKSGEQVALKMYHMENLCELNHFQVYREVRVHSSLQHQNIIHLYAAFQEDNDVVLVQEYAEGGDLYKLLHRNGGRLGERQAVEMVLHPFLLALNYLHTKGIMHRDIKPENVLFTDQKVLKLADFGLALDLNEERAVTRAGTLDYMAPEVLRCPPKNLPQENKNNTYLHYDNSVDAWAVGVFAYELIVGFPPFAGETQLTELVYTHSGITGETQLTEPVYTHSGITGETQLTEPVYTHSGETQLDSVERILHSSVEFPDKTTELAKAFITQALKKHPGDRPTVMEMLHHAWIRSYQRRTSVLYMPTVNRRKNSAACYQDVPNPGTKTLVPSLGPEMYSNCSSSNALPMLYSPSQQSNSAMLASASSSQVADTNPEDMTSDQIEDMIKRLILAKQAAQDRAIPPQIMPGMVSTPMAARH